MKDSDKCMLTATTCGGWIGALAFIVTVLVNALRGLDFSMYFSRALVALAVGYGSGCVFGLIGFGIVQESLAKPEPPVPASPPAEGDVAEAEPQAAADSKPARPKRRGREGL